MPHGEPQRFTDSIEPLPLPWPKTVQALTNLAWLIESHRVRKIRHLFRSRIHEAYSVPKVQNFRVQRTTEHESEIVRRKEYYYNLL